jgi:hypothetical protein
MDTHPLILIQNVYLISHLRFCLIMIDKDRSSHINLISHLFKKHTLLLIIDFLLIFHL